MVLKKTYSKSKREQLMEAIKKAPAGSSIEVGTNKITTPEQMKERKEALLTGILLGAIILFPVSILYDIIVDYFQLTILVKIALLTLSIIIAYKVYKMMINDDLRIVMRTHRKWI